MSLILTPDPTASERALEILAHPSSFSILLLDGSKPPTFCLQSAKGFLTMRYQLSAADECFLTRGWEEFIIGNGLEAGDLLVFYLTGDMHLTLASHDPTACAKDLPLQSYSLAFTPSRFIQLRIILHPYNKYTIPLRMEFLEKAGINLLHEVEIFNRKGGCWDVEVREKRLGPGWVHFWIDSHLVVDDHCVLRCSLDNNHPYGRFQFFKIAP